jgi:zinc protease
VQAETHFMQRLQTVGGFGGKSDQLNAYNTFLGRPDYFVEDVGRYERVTKASLQSTAARYLRDGRRVVMSIVPRGRLDLGVADSSPVAVS